MGGLSFYFKRSLSPFRQFKKGRPDDFHCEKFSSFSNLESPCSWIHSANLFWLNSWLPPCGQTVYKFSTHWANDRGRSDGHRQRSEKKRACFRVSLKINFIFHISYSSLYFSPSKNLLHESWFITCVQQMAIFTILFQAGITVSVCVLCLNVCDFCISSQVFLKLHLSCWHQILEVQYYWYKEAVWRQY